MNISDILEDIGQLLLICNHKGWVNWLRETAYQLSQDQDDLQRKEVLSEIRNSIAGMGSLSDIYLIPPPDANLSKSEANRKLGKLIMILDQNLQRALQEEPD